MHTRVWERHLIDKNATIGRHSGLEVLKDGEGFGLIPIVQDRAEVVELGACNIPR